MRELDIALEVGMGAKSNVKDFLKAGIAQSDDAELRLRSNPNGKNVYICFLENKEVGRTTYASAENVATLLKIKDEKFPQTISAKVALHMDGRKPRCKATISYK